MSENNNLKLEFFVGSTKKDLSEARLIIINSILESKNIPSGMELWAAGKDPLLTDIENNLDQCDAHIIILGARYGEYITTSENISFTEWEFKKSNGKRPIIAFLLKDDEFREAREEVIIADEGEKDKGDELKRFREELQKSRFCTYFSNKEPGIKDIGRLCVNSIHKLINSLDSQDIGWIKASSQEATILREIRENRFLERELERLREFSKLGKRVGFDKVSKETQAKIFWDVMKGRIRRNKFLNIFFESGSTLAYVSDQFEQIVLKNTSSSENWNIWTNSVLTLFQLLLYTDVDVKRFPACAPNPTDNYGAIFPRKWCDYEETAPSVPRLLYEDEKNAVNEIKLQLQEFAKTENNNTLILATSSGWDLSNEIQHFRGPHVGSHPNMLFKHALFTSNSRFENAKYNFIN